MCSLHSQVLDSWLVTGYNQMKILRVILILRLILTDSWHWCPWLGTHLSSYNTCYGLRLGAQGNWKGSAFSLPISPCSLTSTHATNCVCCLKMTGVESAGTLSYYYNEWPNSSAQSTLSLWNNVRQFSGKSLSYCELLDSHTFGQAFPSSSWNFKLLRAFLSFFHVHTFNFCS